MKTNICTYVLNKNQAKPIIEALEKSNYDILNEQKEDGFSEHEHFIIINEKRNWFSSKSPASRRKHLTNEDFIKAINEKTEFDNDDDAFNYWALNILCAPERYVFHHKDMKSYARWYKTITVKEK